MPAEILDVDDFEAGVLHRGDHVREARNPAAGKHVPANVELGVAPADVADEMQHSKPARLEERGVRADHVGELVAPGMLERADGHDLVVLAAHVAEVGLDHVERALQAAARDLAAQPFDLLGRGVEPRHARAMELLGMEHEAAEAAADVDHGFARRKPHLAAHVLDLVALRLLDRARPLAPITARVHHEGVVEPELVEVVPEGVVEARILLRLLPIAVAAAHLVPLVADPDERHRAVETAAHPRGEREGKAALDVDVAVEVRLEEPDVPEGDHAPERARIAKDEAELRLPVLVRELTPVRECHCERRRDAFAEPRELRLDEGAHGVLSARPGLDGPHGPSFRAASGYPTQGDRLKSSLDSLRASPSCHRRSM